MPDRKLKPEYAGLEPFKGQFIQWSYIERKQPKEIRKLFKPIFNEELEETGHQHHLTTKQWATRKTKWYKEFGIEKKGQGPSEDQLQKLDSLRLWFVDGQPYEQPQTFSEDPKSQLTLSKRFELRRQQPDKILPELENEGESRVGGAYQSRSGIRGFAPGPKTTGSTADVNSTLAFGPSPTVPDLHYPCKPQAQAACSYEGEDQSIIDGNPFSDAYSQPVDIDNLWTPMPTEQDLRRQSASFADSSTVQHTFIMPNDPHSMEETNMVLAPERNNFASDDFYIPTHTNDRDGRARTACRLAYTQRTMKF